MNRLAINGGEPVRTKKFPDWPQYDGSELSALERVVKSREWGTLGTEVGIFTKKFAQYQQSKYGIAVTNGTNTLEVILRALEIGYGDEVILPPYTFIASASAVIMVGATPVFVDIDDATYNIDSTKIEKAITSKTKAIIPVHIAGRSCDMDSIMQIANRHGIKVVEDCAHAPGSEWDGKRIGAIGHAGSFSFQNSKNLSSGEGGFITTNDAALYERCWSIHHCGRDIHSDEWYMHPYIGTNARMTEWQAGILNSQMSRLDAQIEKRMTNAEYLNKRLQEIPCVAPLSVDKKITRNSIHLYIFKYYSEICNGLSRELFMEALVAEGIPCSPGYTSLYKQPMLHGDEMKRITGSKIRYEDLYLESSEKASNKEGIWLTQNLLLAEKKDIDEIADAIIKVYTHADQLK